MAITASTFSDYVGRRCMAPVVALLWIAILFQMQFASAMQVKTTPALTLGYLNIQDVTADAVQQPNAVDPSWAYTISPQLQMRAAGSLLRGEFAGSLQHFQYANGERQNIYSALGASRLQAIPETFFVDWRGSVQQRSLLLDPLVEQNRYQISSNRTDVFSMSVAPSYILHGAEYDTDFQYSRDFVRVRHTDVGDLDSQRYVINMTSNIHAERSQSWWKIHIEERDSFFRNYGDSSHREFGGEYRFNISRVLGAELSGGVERNHGALLSQGNNSYSPYWMMLARLRPEPLFDINFAVGRRNFGMTYLGGVAYRVRSLNIGGDYSESIVDAVPLDYTNAIAPGDPFLRQGPYVSRRYAIHANYESPRAHMRMSAYQDTRGYTFSNSKDVMRAIDSSLAFRATSRSVFDVSLRLDYNSSTSVFSAGSYVGAMGSYSLFVGRYMIWTAKAVAYNRNYSELSRDVKNVIYIAEITLRN